MIRQWVFCETAYTILREATISHMPFDRERMKEKAAALAAKGVFVGTSSWKYEGWLGQLYTPARYEYRGKFAKTRFDRDCLSEYAEVFKTVSVEIGRASCRERV